MNFIKLPAIFELYLVEQTDKEIKIVYLLVF